MFKRSLFVLSFVILAFAADQAYAGTTITSCGTPDQAKLETDPDVKYCDIYSRQLAYATEAKKFSALLKERQENFGNANVKMERQYKKSLNSYYGYDAEPDEEPATEESPEQSAEAFGPAQSGTTTNP